VKTPTLRKQVHAWACNRYPSEFGAAEIAEAFRVSTKYAASITYELAKSERLECTKKFESKTSPGVYRAILSPEDMEVVRYSKNTPTPDKFYETFPLIRFGDEE
jgi:hypothetical protein